VARSKIPAEWLRHLTPELRGEFDRGGATDVQFAVSNRGYITKEKQLAAQAWLAEQRNRRARRDAIQFHLILWIALVTLIAIAVVIAVI
jgi:hypothetical protein